MVSTPDSRRRMLNVIAAAASFFLLVGTARVLGTAARLLFSAPDGGAGIDAAVWAISFLLSTAALSAVYRPAPTPERILPEDAESIPPPPRPARRPAYLVPSAVFVLIAFDILIYFAGLSPGNTDAGVGSGDFLLRAALGCVVFPILEETFFRGLFLRALREKEDRLPVRIGAVAAQAVAFAALHTSGGYVFPLLAGLVLAAVAPRGGAESERSFIPVGCVIAHGAYNLSLYVSAALGEYGVCDPILALAACAGVSAIAAGLTILVSKR